jgi:hypothetical protein
VQDSGIPATSTMAAWVVVDPSLPLKRMVMRLSPMPSVTGT